MKFKLTIINTILLLALSNLTFSQENKTITNVTEDQIEISLYRGIIQLDSCKCNKVHIVQQILDYDEYDEKKTISFIDDDNANLKIDRTNKSILKISNEQSRNIQKLVITVPEQVKIKILINHYGEVYFNGSANELDVQIFKGRVQGTTTKPISASVIRDGRIDLKVDGGAFELVYASIYNGPINLELQKNLSTDFDIQMDIGGFKNLTNASLNKTKGPKGDIKENGAVTNFNTKYYKGYLNSKNKNLITLKNAKGDIIIKTTN
ncbi:hypothetical protein D7030_04850 [Flavobacteriaceae bacterium AU392]|nr:hypothetical protein D1817_11325 [Flavobacteriaceae bacterium]RKM86004.1 hypothetical protein D7030_04850 [Flavobacteriaceae bacterium AU392]